MSAKVSAKSARRQAFADERAALKTVADEQKAALKSSTKAFTTDNFQNFAAGLGLGTDNLSSYSTYGFNPITRIRPRLEWIHRGSWMGGVAIDLPAEHMTKYGVSFSGDLDADAQDKLKNAALIMNIWGELCKLVKWSRLYGGAIAVYLIQGQNYATPLRLETVGADQFKGLLTLDRWQLQPSLNDLVTEEGPYMGQPKYYKVLGDAPGLRNQVIHYTRVIRMIGVELPWWQAQTEDLWGESFYERIYDRMVAYDSTTAGIAQLVYKAHLRTYKIKDLRSVIATGGEALRGLYGQVDMMRRTQSIEGITLLDGEDEFEAFQIASFAGLADVARMMAEQVCGGLRIPLTIFLGLSPGGLGSNGDGERKNYFEDVNKSQNTVFRPGVPNVYRLIAQSLGIKLDDSFDVQFNSLMQLTETEKAELAKTITETIQTGLDAGLSSPQTGMKELKRSSKITGIWNIPDNEIEAADEQLAPSPADLQEAAMEQGTEESQAGREHASSEAEAAREHAATEADKNRTQQIRLAQTPKPGAKTKK